MSTPIAGTSKVIHGKSNVTETFGLTKDLKNRIRFEIRCLEPVDEAKITNTLLTASEKYRNPSLLQVLSRVYLNSDLYLNFQLFDGSHNPISVPIQTPYLAFKRNKREWNRVIELPIGYKNLSKDDYFSIKIYEISNTAPRIFGVGVFYLFDNQNATLKVGRQKIPIFVSEESLNGANLREISNSVTSLDQKIYQHKNNEVVRIPWLDKITLPQLEEARSNSNNDDTNNSFLEDQIGSSGDYFLYIDMPNFGIPVIFSDCTAKLPEKVKTFEEIPKKVSPPVNSNVIMNSIEIPMTRQPYNSSIKIYDPDFQCLYLRSNGLATPNGGGNTHYNYYHDPIDTKFHRLERNMNNNLLLDKELKPSPQTRDDLMKILRKASNIELTEEEKNLIWKFRYYFSRNVASKNTDNIITGSANGVTTDTRFFFMKFLKSLNWGNEFELNHAFGDIIPNYWSYEKIEIGDALELLGSYFDPEQLSMRFSVTNNNLTIDSEVDENTRYENILTRVVFLRSFAVDRLKLASSEEILLYLLQLVQALKYETIVYKNYPKVNNNSLTEDIDVFSSPLVSFLIKKSLEDNKIGNFFYWYVKVENEDFLNKRKAYVTNIYTMILNAFIDSLKKHSQKNKLPHYRYLKKQIWLIKSLTKLVENLRVTFKKGEATSKKTQYLRQYLGSSSNELNKFAEPFPLPLDPSIYICGCYPEESFVFKSSLSPFKITFKTIENYSEAVSHHSQLFGKKHYTYGKYPLMFKIGDDLRQDQLVIQVINLMDQLLKNENLDLELTPYRILATSPVAGLIQFVPNETLDSVLAKNYTNYQDESGRSRSPIPNVSSNGIASNGILNYLRENSSVEGNHDTNLNSQIDMRMALHTSITSSTQHAISTSLGVSPNIIDNYVKSCAGYCVITYILGVGDRHLDNLLISPNGKFWHVDFGYILGHDPKPFPPLMKLPIQVIDGMGGMNHENFNIFKSYCFISYITLRKNSNLILNLFQLMSDANIPDIQNDPKRALDIVQEKFGLEMTEEEAIIHFQNLINDSVNAFLPVVIDRLHSLAQYWRA